jgi:uridine kinase
LSAKRIQPFLIGIAGPSGSGKTALARRLAPLLPRDCAVISLDSYYRPQSHLPLEERARLNYDHPDALDWDLLWRHLDCLRRGHAVEQPIYRFNSHTRDTSTRRVPPRPFLILEGILTLYCPKIRDLLDLKIFVDTADRECLGRRVRRDVAERGRTEDSVRDQYSATVRPMALEYVLPSRQYADLVVSGEEPIDAAVDRVLAALRVFRA